MPRVLLLWVTMRIGLTAAGSTIDRLTEQAKQAESDGFASLWYTGALAGDPLAAIAVVGRATSSIELGTAIVQTYPCHPVLQAGRAAGVAAAVGPGRFTLGVGPSHQPVIEQMLGLDYSSPGLHTEEYLQVLSPLLHGQPVDFEGREFRVRAGAPPLPDGAHVPILLAALGPRLLRVAGQLAAGTITWMGTAKALSDHVVPRIRKAAREAGRTDPRIVAGLPVAVHDDVAEAREAAAGSFAIYGNLPNYQHLLARGGASGPAEAVIVGDEESVRSQIEELFSAGATDVWAAPFAVGSDRSGSRSRTMALLKDLAVR